MVVKTGTRAASVQKAPASRGKGRDVIATKHGVGSVRFFDQVKRYGADYLVTANDVRAMIGVLSIEPNVSKGIITTTTDFAPGVYTDDNIKKFMPHRKLSMTLRHRG
jgi:restriction system protein